MNKYICIKFFRGMMPSKSQFYFSIFGVFLSFATNAMPITFDRYSIDLIYFNDMVQFDNFTFGSAFGSEGLGQSVSSLSITNGSPDIRIHLEQDSNLSHAELANLQIDSFLLGTATFTALSDIDATSGRVLGEGNAYFVSTDGVSSNQLNTFLVTRNINNILDPSSLRNDLLSQGVNGDLVNGTVVYQWLNETKPSAGNQFSVSLFLSPGNNNSPVATVPEPSSIFLLIFGLLGIPLSSISKRPLKVPFVESK